MSIFPAGAPRTGAAIAASLALLAQLGSLREGASAAALAAHLASSALAYLLFVNLSQRRLGAPLIAALLFGAHPVAAATLSSAHGLREAAGTALGLLSGILLARTPLAPRLLVPSLGAYVGSLVLAPALALLPFLVAAAVVAYHGLEPRRLLTRRLLARFLPFAPLLLAAAAFLAARAPGRGFGAVGDAVAFVWPFASAPAIPAVAGAAALVVALAFGIARLRASPKLAWPLLALAASLACVTLLPDAWGEPASAYAPLAFAALLVAEGIEKLFFLFGAAFAMPLVFVVYGALAVQSHLR